MNHLLAGGGDFPIDNTPDAAKMFLLSPLAPLPPAMESLS